MSGSTPLRPTGEAAAAAGADAETTSSEPPAPGWTLPPAELVALAGIVVAQAAWLAVWCSRGWFYTDDFQDMAQSLHRPLGIPYLTTPLNNHLSPGVRLEFWLVTHGIGLHYPPTIVLRVLVQAVCTVLLYRLLRLVTPSARLALAVTAVYAFSPLLVPGTLWMTTAITLQLPQLLSILAFEAHIRHVRSGSWRWAAATGVALIGAAVFWEKSGVTAILLVLLSVGWLHAGTLRQRLAAVLRDWLGWLLTIGPLLGFALYDVTSGHASSATGLPAASALHLVWLQWSHAVWPAAIGGPWRWFSVGAVYQSIASPARLTVILGQAAFLALAVVGWRRNRWSGLFAWVLPLTSVAVGVVLVGVGRYATFGDITATDFHYAFDVAVPMALAAVLSLSRPATTEPQPVGPSRWRRTGRGVVAVAAAGALLASCTASALSWTNRWHASPAHTYTATVLRSIRALGPDATVYNTAVSLRVLPFIEGDRQIADLLSLAGVHAHINNGPEAAEVIDDSGHARPATFSVAAVGGGTTNPFCPNLLRGLAPLTIRLTSAVPPNEYFVQLTFFQNRPTRILVTAKDAAGAPVPVSDGSVTLNPTLGQVVLGLGYGRPARLTIRGTDAETNTCLSKVVLGVPVATS